jgi:hypothetical protein
MQHQTSCKNSSHQPDIRSTLASRANWTFHASWSQRLPLKTPSSKKLEDFASSERRPCWIHFLTLPLKKEAADSKFNSAK